MSVNKLLGCSLVGLGACIGVYQIFTQRLSESLKNCLIYKEALTILKTHEGAIEFLGEPIDDVAPRLNNSSMFFDGSTEFVVNVSGPKSKGKLFVTALGESIEKLKLNTIQLQIGNDTNKRLVIKDSVVERTNKNSTEK